jgi:DNA modification methylase
MAIEVNKLYNDDCKNIMDRCDTESINLIYTDTPYNLGSLYEIDEEGHYNFLKSMDFMDQWEAMDGRWWCNYFQKAFRIIKQGGFYITHNIDRQSDLWTYYARRAGFIPLQKLYWLFLSSMPKGVDLTKQIDNLLGVDRVVVGKAKGAQKISTGTYGNWGQKANEDGSYNLTIPTSKLARKYAGYVYGVAPFKQIMEEILVFWKPFTDKNMTVPKSIISGNNKYHPAVFNLEATKPSGKDLWTPQALVDKKMIPQLLNSPYYNHEEVYKVMQTIQPVEIDDSCLEIPFFNPETDRVFFEPKISPKERDEGLEDFEYVQVTDGRKNPDPKQHRQNSQTALRKNPHPSPKPGALCKWVLTLFRPPVDIVVLDTFMGSGQIPKSCKELGINYIGVELNELYFKVAQAKLNSVKEKLI